MKQSRRRTSVSKDQGKAFGELTAAAAGWNVRLRLKPGTLQRELGMRSPATNAQLGRFLRFTYVLDLCVHSGRWPRLRSLLTENGHLHRSLRSSRPAKSYLDALKAQMEPTYVRRRTALYCRRMLTVVVEEYYGRTWARSWLWRRNPLLGGETPRSRARDFRGFVVALQALLLDRRRLDDAARARLPTLLGPRRDRRA